MIKAALAGRDVLGLAETGSGKTLAFVLPLLCAMVGAILALYFYFRRRGPLTLQVECGCSPTCAWMPYFKLTEVEK